MLPPTIAARGAPSTVSASLDATATADCTPTDHSPTELTPTDHTLTGISPSEASPPTDCTPPKEDELREARRQWDFSGPAVVRTESGTELQLSSPVASQATPEGLPSWAEAAEAEEESAESGAAKRARRQWDLSGTPVVVRTGSGRRVETHAVLSSLVARTR